MRDKAGLGSFEVRSSLVRPFRGRASLVRSFLLLSTIGGASKARAAEVELPGPAPAAKLSQQVGLTEIALEYDCPATRGKKIWGDVVPYDRPWNIGSAPAPKIRFSRDVEIGDRLVPAGTYWLVAIPGRSTWTIMLDRSADLPPLSGDAKSVDVARVKVPVKPAPHRERVTFLFSEVADDKASLDLEWDNARVSVPIKVNTSQQVEAAITNLDNTWRSFANAARYMLETKKDYDKGLRFIDESLALQSVDHVQDWYSLWIKGALLAAKGRFGEAAEISQTAYSLARASGPFLLEPELSRSIAEWRKRRPFEKERAVAVTPAAVTVPPPFAGAEAAAPVGQGVSSKESSPSAPASPSAEAAVKVPVDPKAAEATPLRRARLRKR